MIDKAWSNAISSTILFYPTHSNLITIFTSTQFNPILEMYLKWY